MTSSLLDKRVLPLGEWFAENAYIAPGKHRLMTALGLMSGLLLGRELMNLLTGVDHSGKPINRDALAPPLQRFCGCLAYNKYEDTPQAKWHKVAESFVPMFFGAAGAMAGSAEFAKTTPMMTALVKDLAKNSKHFHLQHADMLANKNQASLMNTLAGLGLNMGSTTGVHLFPAMLASSTSAFRFQIDHGKNIILPGLRSITGNRGHSSRNMFNSLTDFIQWAENNAAHYTKQGWQRENTNRITHYAKDMLQVFKEVTPAQRKIVEKRLEEVCEQLDDLAVVISQQTGKKGEELVQELASENSAFRQVLKQFVNEGLEESFMNAGLIDPANMEKTMKNIALGDYGIISVATRLLGGRRQVQSYRDQLTESILKRKDPAAPNKPVSDLIPKDNVPYLGSLAAAGATIGAASVLGHRYRQHKRDLSDALNRIDTSAASDEASFSPDTLPRHMQARMYHREQNGTSGNSVKDFINGKPLDALHWMSNVLVVPPSLHRFMNAATLSLFLIGGAKVSSALAARELRGKPLSKDQIWPILRPLYGHMKYVWKSDKTADRWNHVAHQLMPVTVGMFGTYLGSRLYFYENINKAERAEYLEDYTDRILLEESETYAKASALTSILNTGSGFHMLPLVSYPSNLQNRFLMAKGQQIATPVLGKWWSGNPSNYPWHVRMLLDRMITYAVENTSEFPKEFDKMMFALVAKLYPDKPMAELEEKRDMLVEKLYSIRDDYWRPGGIPDDRKGAAKEAIEGAFRREGLEKTLMEAGLNPLEANLDNNGMGAMFAHWSGAKGQVDKSIADYRTKAAARLKQTAPDTEIQVPPRETTKPMILAERAQPQQVHI